MLRSILFIKFVHALFFFFMSRCIGVVLYSAITDRITSITWIAFGMVLIEGLVLLVNGWRCPLTVYAEGLGAPSGSVTDIFLPRWLADRAFVVCGGLFGLATVALFVRIMS